MDREKDMALITHVWLSLALSSKSYDWNSFFVKKRILFQPKMFLDLNVFFFFLISCFDLDMDFSTNC